MTCPINYDLENCSSSDYGMDCSTCAHSGKQVAREYFKIEADIEFSPYWSNEIMTFQVVESMYKEMVQNDQYSNVKAYRIAEYADGSQKFSELYIR
jgi:hypothetical protein